MVDLQKKIKKTFRKLIRSGKPKNIRVSIIRFYKSRLDSTLYRAKFISSVSTARRLIKQGNIIRVNGKKIINPAYNLQTRKATKFCKNYTLTEISPTLLELFNFVHVISVISS